MFKKWLAAFRLRTLPLAFSSILMGSFLAYKTEFFKWNIFFLCLLTTIFLQVLSNLANDYGDYINGADNAERIGPKRSTQSGEISLSTMKNAIFIFGFLALVSGISLLFAAFGLQNMVNIILFLILGLFAIWSAYNYTAGENPYGYRALGDVFVFIFFGLVGVLGVVYLQTQSIILSHLLPASASGLMAVSVLNINNTRDLNPDKTSGKITIPVLIGLKNVRLYQWILLITSVLFLTIYTFIQTENRIFSYLFLGITPLFYNIGKNISVKEGADLDPYLKKMALSSLLTTILFGIGLLIK